MTPEDAVNLLKRIESQAVCSYYWLRGNDFVAGLQQSFRYVGWKRRWRPRLVHGFAMTTRIPALGRRLAWKVAEFVAKERFESVVASKEGLLTDGVTRSVHEVASWKMANMKTIRVAVFTASIAPPEVAYDLLTATGRYLNRASR